MCISEKVRKMLEIKRTIKENNRSQKQGPCNSCGVYNKMAQKHTQSRKTQVQQLLNCNSCLHNLPA